MVRLDRSVSFEIYGTRSIVFIFVSYRFLKPLQPGALRTYTRAVRLGRFPEAHRQDRVNDLREPRASSRTLARQAYP